MVDENDKVTQEMALPEGLQELKNDAAIINKVDFETYKRQESVFNAGRLAEKVINHKFTTIVLIKAYEEYKISKKYKDLFIEEKGVGIRPVRDLREFCTNFLGYSYSTMQEKTKNLQALGEEAYITALDLSFGRNEFRVIQKLPEDEKELVTLALESKDKDGALEVLERFIEKSNKEKEAFKKALKEAELNAETNDRIIEAKTKKINELDKNLTKQGLRLSGWEAEVDDLNIAITVSAGQAQMALSNLDLMREKMRFLELEDDHREAAEERLATNYYATMKSLLITIDEMMNVCQAEFGHYEDRAMPLMDQYLEQQNEQ